MIFAARESRRRGAINVDTFERSADYAAMLMLMFEALLLTRRAQPTVTRTRVPSAVSRITIRRMSRHTSRAFQRRRGI